MKNGTGLQNNLNKVWFLYDNCHCNDPWKKNLLYEKRKTDECWQLWQWWLQQWLDRLQFKVKTDFYHDSKNCWTFLRWVRIVHWQEGLEKTWILLTCPYVLFRLKDNFLALCPLSEWALSMEIKLSQTTGQDFFRSLR